jgi:hypothetical protein
VSGKRRHIERKARIQQRQRQTALEAEARGIAVDRNALAFKDRDVVPAFVERGYYVDQDFDCVTCGVPQTWTAVQQKWWYEVAKGSATSTARLCRACRRVARERKEQIRLTGGDANPYKSVGLILAKVRREIEPDLTLAGYVLTGRSLPQAQPRYLKFLEYQRTSDLLTIVWNQHVATLTAELLSNGEDEVRTIASIELSGARSTFDIEDRIAPFIVAVRSLARNEWSDGGPR